MLKNPDYFGSEVSAPGKDIIYPVTEGSGSLELVRVHKVLTLSHTLSLRMIPLKLAAGSLRIRCGGDRAGLTCVKIVIFVCERVEAQKVGRWLAVQT